MGDFRLRLHCRLLLKHGDGATLPFALCFHRLCTAKALPFLADSQVLAHVATITVWEPRYLFFAYRPHFQICLCLWAWGANLYIFQHFKVNHVLVLGLSAAPDRYLHPAELMRLAGIWTMVSTDTQPRVSIHYCCDCVCHPAMLSVGFAVRASTACVGFSLASELARLGLRDRRARVATRACPKPASSCNEKKCYPKAIS